MKLTSDIPGSANKIRVEILEVLDDTIKCKHITSGFEVTAYIKNNIHVEVGQIVLLEYKKVFGNSGYIISDTLMEEMDALVLEAHHIISEGVMYTSLIIENPLTKKRMHSLVPSNSKLFGNTSIIIKGDVVKLRINNGNLFSIQY